MSDEEQSSLNGEVLPAVISRTPDGKWLPGRSGNPGGKPRITTEYAKCKLLCRERSLEAATKMIDLFRTSDDHRVQFMAAQWVYEQAWGKAPVEPFDPDKERDTAALDLAKLSPDQRQQLRALLQAAVGQEHVTNDGTADSQADVSQ